MLEHTQTGASFGYREALEQVSHELIERLRAEQERQRREKCEPRESQLVDGRGLALS